MRMLCSRFFASLGLALPGLAPVPAHANTPEIVDVEVRCNATRKCDFSVTVRHADTGWDHYATAFEILDLEGNVIATRTLRHPHVHEQPFTRSLERVAVPKSVERVKVRARDLVHGVSKEPDRELLLPFPGS